MAAASPLLPDITDVTSRRHSSITARSQSIGSLHRRTGSDISSRASSTSLHQPSTPGGAVRFKESAPRSFFTFDFGSGGADSAHLELQQPNSKPQAPSRRRSCLSNSLLMQSAIQEMSEEPGPTDSSRIVSFSLSAEETDRSSAFARRMTPAPDEMIQAAQRARREVLLPSEEMMWDDFLDFGEQRGSVCHQKLCSHHLEAVRGHL